MKKAMVNLHAVVMTAGQLTTVVVVLSNLYMFISRVSGCKFYSLNLARLERITRRCTRK